VRDSVIPGFAPNDDESSKTSSLDRIRSGPRPRRSHCEEGRDAAIQQRRLALGHGWIASLRSQ
jgi:hypothetical protein